MIPFNPFFEEFNENIGKLNMDGLDAKQIGEWKISKDFKIITMMNLQLKFLHWNTSKRDFWYAWAQMRRS